jgi:ferredoxin--NADP+ reductase
MNRILEKQLLAPGIVRLEVEAPRISRVWKAGQFVIVRPTAGSERIPLTIVGGGRERGSLTLVIQAVGKTTQVACALEPGESLADLAGPLGEPATVERSGQVLCVGGGVGVGELLPVAAACREAGGHVVVICGVRSWNYRILEPELRRAAHEVHWATEDGSAGFLGTVVDLMRHWWSLEPRELTLVHLIGPVGMMQAAAEVTRQWGVRTLASLNPIMLDGTGMCGGCRVTVGGQVRFACVEGPEFDAHQVDFQELARRNAAYVQYERQALDQHLCRLGLKA